MPYIPLRIPVATYAITYILACDTCATNAIRPLIAMRKCSHRALLILTEWLRTSEPLRCALPLFKLCHQYESQMAEGARRSCSEMDHSPSPAELKSLANSGFDCKLVFYNELLIETLLDKGQFGSVFKGTWNGVSIAIKELDDYTDPKEFSDEVWLMSQLDHDNIVRFVGACTTPRLCIVMEFIEGGSLYRALHVERRQLEPDDVTSLLRDIAKGLSYLHAQGVLHRDLKSKNVLLSGGKCPLTAKLCDFGVSKLQTKASTHSDDVGTLLWMAPEVVRSRRHSEGSDVYSFGAVIYEVLTNSLPFSDMKELNHYNIMYLLCIEAKKLCLPDCVLPRTPLQIKYVLDRCLDHCVDLRPPACHLAALLEGVDWEDTCSVGGDSSPLSDADAFDDEPADTI